MDCGIAANVPLDAEAGFISAIVPWFDKFLTGVLFTDVNALLRAGDVEGALVGCDIF